MAAFLARSGLRGFGEVLEADGEAEVGFDFCASPSRRLTFGDAFCDEFWYEFMLGGNSAEIEVSAPPELRGGGKEDGSV